MVKQRK